MKTVQPIRDAQIISQVKQRLQNRGAKYYIMFVIGLNTGLRIGDILNLTAADVKDKTHVTINEKKTGKYKRFLINQQLKKEIDGYLDSAQLAGGDYIVVSRKGDNRPISRVHAYRILNDVAQQLNLSEIGTHTMRKTFGYWHYQQFKDVALLQDIFNHSAPSVTLRYIGINDDIKDNTLKDFFL
jgi:integrase